MESKSLPVAVRYKKYSKFSLTKRETPNPQRHFKEANSWHESNCMIFEISAKVQTHAICILKKGLIFFRDKEILAKPLALFPVKELNKKYCL